MFNYFHIYPSTYLFKLLNKILKYFLLISCVPVLITERPSKKDEPFREDRRKIDPSGAPPRGGNPMPRLGPGSRGGHPMHPPPGAMGPPGNYGGSGSHKDIKLTLLNKVTTAPLSVFIVSVHPKHFQLIVVSGWTKLPGWPMNALSLWVSYDASVFTLPQPLEDCNVGVHAEEVKYSPVHKVTAHNPP